MFQKYDLNPVKMVMYITQDMDSGDGFEVD
jgi:hypothetical protein